MHGRVDANLTAICFLSWFKNHRLIVRIALIGVLIPALLILNAEITAWTTSNGFREMLDRATSKGLKIEGRYTSIHRVGLLGLHADSFNGTNGRRAIVALDANDISGTFNPLGIALRRWEIDNLHIKSGSVLLQKTLPGKNQGPRRMPWWGLFWPYRIHLADVKVDDANILWQLRNRESGIYHTFLEITPNGRDFEYDARGGKFRTPLTPRLEVRHAHLLIRKPRLYCSEFILGDDNAHPEQQLRVEGNAGLQQDRSIHLKIDLASLNIPPWLPNKLRPHATGQASGHLEYESSNTGLETSRGLGTITITKGVLHEITIVRQFIAVTGSSDPGDLTLKTCRADIHWQGSTLTMTNLEVECENVFRLTGTITITENQTLSGEIELGLTDSYLHWLPTARESIFKRDRGPYHFTTVHLSGTLQKPKEDLSSRLIREVEKSPLLALKLFFRQIGEYLNFD
jgi:hypothetical protein